MDGSVVIHSVGKAVVAKLGSEPSFGRNSILRTQGLNGMHSVYGRFE